MQTRQTSKILSLLVAVCLILGVLPMAAFAVSGNDKMKKSGN